MLQLQYRLGKTYIKCGHKSDLNDLSDLSDLC